MLPFPHMSLFVIFQHKHVLMYRVPSIQKFQVRSRKESFSTLSKNQRDFLRAEIVHESEQSMQGLDCPTSCNVCFGFYI